MTGERLFCDCMIAEEFIKEFDELFSSENNLSQQMYNCDESCQNLKHCWKKSFLSTGVSRF